MNKFTLLDSPEQSHYFSDVDLDKLDGDELYEVETKLFGNYTKNKFLEELKKHSDIKKQAGFSKSNQCNFVSLILVRHNTGDGEFTGHTFKSTYLIHKDNKIMDMNKNEDLNEEVGLTHRAAYHVLPDGKLLEFIFKSTYDKEIKFIYDTIAVTRCYYDFESKFPTKDNNSGKTLKL